MMPVPLSSYSDRFPMPAIFAEQTVLGYRNTG